MSHSAVLQRRMPEKALADAPKQAMEVQIERRIAVQQKKENAEKTIMFLISNYFD